MYREHQLHMQEIESTVHSAKSARDAVRHGRHPGFEMPVASAEPFKAKLEALVAKNDKAGVVTLAKQLRRDSQDRLQSNLMTLTAESCKEIGFETVTLRPEQGILTARSATKGGIITVEVAKGKDGDAKTSPLATASMEAPVSSHWKRCNPARHQESIFASHLIEGKIALLHSMADGRQRRQQPYGLVLAKRTALPTTSHHPMATTPTNPAPTASSPILEAIRAGHQAMLVSRTFALRPAYQRARRGYDRCGIP